MRSARPSCSTPPVAGDRAATARLLSLVERGGDGAREVGRLAAPLAGNAYTVGLTGAPGAGKSTLTSAVIGHLRSRGDEVAVLAVDPSSPFTGGAILGDRVRMQDHATDPGVFIRSMATRGHSAGWRWRRPRRSGCSTPLGHPWVLVETVGVGQVEVEVAGKADTTVVVVNPGWGDSVQANKAGLMEVADMFVINKADRAGVDETAPRPRADARAVGRARRTRLAGADRRRRSPRRARACPSCGRPSRAHRDHVDATGELERRRRFRLGEELREIVARRLEQRAREVCTGERWDALNADVLDGELDPWSAADQMLDRASL